jgi:hypothetical protein
MLGEKLGYGGGTQRGMLSDALAVFWKYHSASRTRLFADGTCERYFESTDIAAAIFLQILCLGSQIRHSSREQTLKHVTVRQNVTAQAKDWEAF